MSSQRISDASMIRNFYNFTSLFAPRKNVISLVLGRSNNRFAALDGLRALSVIWIIAFHVIWFSGYVLPPQQYAELFHRPEFFWASHGALGVDIFFVLSGFLISRILFIEIRDTRSIDIRNFYIRRALRILPAYYVALAILAALFPRNSENVLYNIFYLNNFLSIRDQFMGWSWSLAIEEQFYTVFPLLVLLLFRWPKQVLPVLFSLLGFAVLIRFHIIHAGNLVPPPYMHPAYDFSAFTRYFDLVYDKPYMRYGGLVAGALIAYLNVFTSISGWLASHHWSRRGLITGSLALSLVYLIFNLSSDSPVVSLQFSLLSACYPYGFSVGIAGLILYLLTPSGGGSLIHRLLSAKIWYPIAQLSYSAYLLHPIIIMLLLRSIYQNGAPDRIEMVGILFAIGAIIFGASMLMYLLIEKPFMNARGWLPNPKTRTVLTEA